MRLSVFLCLWLAGCTTLSTKLPDIPDKALANEQAFQEQEVFAQMAKHQKRLNALASKILIANHELCKKTGPEIGALTHTLKSYDKKLRPAAARELGAGDDPVVYYVRSGSPADRAGLKIGERLLGAEGKPLSLPGKDFTRHIKGGAKLRVEREGVSQPISFKPNTACAYPVRLKMSAAINAYANGKAITVTAGMMNFAASDDELAMIIGHELAHNELGHIRKIITNYALSLGATRYARPFESEADYVGLYYAARAGFNIDNVEDIWRRLARQSARPIARAKTHPAYPDRYVRLRAAREEILQKQEAGEDLVPNRKDGS